VDEERQYTSWTDNEDLAKENSKYVTFNSALFPAKKALNDLHFWLGQNTFSQVNCFTFHLFILFVISILENNFV
jgi:hypothetical protein